MSDSFAYLTPHKNSFARVTKEKGKRKERERTLTIATGYPGVQTFPTPSPPQLFIFEPGSVPQVYQPLNNIKRKEKELMEEI